MFIKLNKNNLLHCSKVIKLLGYSSICGLNNIRCVSNNSQQNQSTNTLSNKEWKTIYRLKSINVFVGINKLKQYQAVLAACSVPLAMALESTSSIGSGFASICAAIGLSPYIPLLNTLSILELLFLGITGTVTLSLYSGLSKNLIGYVYTHSKDSSLVRLSYIDFWGRRKNIELKLTDIQSDPYDLKYGVYLPVTTTVDNKTYKLLPHLGHVHDRGAFTNIFGEF